jgi:iron complex outermembrane receptor protein
MKQDNVGLFETPTSSYNLVSFGLGGDLEFNSLKFNTTISVNNLFNTKYVHHLSRLKPDGILNAGRNIVMGVRFKI